MPHAILQFHSIVVVERQTNCEWGLHPMSVLCVGGARLKGPSVGETLFNLSQTINHCSLKGLLEWAGVCLKKEKSQLCWVK